MPTASSLEDAARQMALTLADTKAKRVVVLDFAMPQRAEWNRVGQKLAAKLRANLAAAAPNILQLSAGDIAAHMKQYNLAQEDMPIGGVSDFTFEHSGADTWIGAEIVDKRPGDILIKFTAHSTDKITSPYYGLDLTMPLTEELSALVDPPAPEPQWAQDLHFAGGRGYSSPACEYCPQSEYTDAAVRAKVQGMVTLVISVEPSGTAGDIYATRTLPFGLTDAAIKSVRGWRFKPALGPDGKPVAVAQNVEVQFHLY